MVTIGKQNLLRVVKTLDFGCYLDGEEHGEILIPRRYVPQDTQVDDELDVFIYFDSEDRLIATTEQPHIMLDEIARLKVVAVTPVGAFLDWGLTKDLLVPFSEQKQRMEVGKWYIVSLFHDLETNRLAGTAKIEKLVDNTPPNYEVGEEVDLLIYSKSDLGYTAIINHSHWGVLYSNEVFRNIRIGESCKGYIKKVREDHKIDLLLDQPGYGKVEVVAQDILERMQENGGYLPLTDKSDPETIQFYLGISKKVFKKAVGALYKERLIRIDDDGIRLIESCLM